MLPGALLLFCFALPLPRIRVFPLHTSGLCATRAPLHTSPTGLLGGLALLARAINSTSHIPEMVGTTDPVAASNTTTVHPFLRKCHVVLCCVCCAACGSESSTSPHSFFLSQLQVFAAIPTHLGTCLLPLRTGRPGARGMHAVPGGALHSLLWLYGPFSRLISGPCAPTKFCVARSRVGARAPGSTGRCAGLAG